MSELAVIIVNYETPKLVMDCLRSLAVEIAGLGSVIIVDNGSRDGSVTKLRDVIESENWTNWVALVPLDHNVGYSAGNNAGIRHAQKLASPPDFYLLLNPDTMVRPGAFQTSLQFMRNHPDVGIAGSRLEDSDGTPQRSAFRFPSLLGELEGGLRLGVVTRLLNRAVVAPPMRDVAHPTDWVAGASMMIRREVVEQIGLMDEDYFLYFEEVDYCRKAQRAGWPVWYVPTSRVIHLVGQSTGVTDMKAPPTPVPSYWFESRRRYFVKNHGLLYAAIANLIWAGAFALWRVRRWVQRKPDTDPPGLLGDFMRFNFVGNPARGPA